MEIIVNNHKIETREITSIVDVEHNKNFFLNREAGFIIYFFDKPSIVVSEKIPYDSYPSEISSIKSKYAKLQQQVTAKWQEDKNDIPTFNI